MKTLIARSVFNDKKLHNPLPWNKNTHAIPRNL